MDERTKALADILIPKHIQQKGTIMALPIEGGFGDVQATDFNPVPDGTYDALVSKAEVKTSGENAKYPGQPYVSWTFDITTPGFENRKAWYTTSMVPQSRGALKRFLLGVGYTEEELNVEVFDLDPDEIVGRECRLKIKVEPNKQTDEPQHVVKSVLPALSELPA